MGCGSSLHPSGARNPERESHLADRTPEHPAFEKMTSKTYVAGAIMVALGVVGVLMMFLKPRVHPLLIMFFYSIPSNCAVSVFPHEPAMILYGKTVNAWHLATIATLGTLLAAFLDYRFFSTLLNIEVTAAHYRERPFYRKARSWFYKAPFVSLVVAGASPIPFFPFKFLVYASRYPIWRYLLAAALGRFPRYLVLALLGYVLKIPTWIIVGGFVVLVLAMYSRRILDWIAGRIWPDRPSPELDEDPRPAVEEETLA